MSQTFYHSKVIIEHCLMRNAENESMINCEYVHLIVKMLCDDDGSNLRYVDDFADNNGVLHNLKERMQLLKWQ